MKQTPILAILAFSIFFSHSTAMAQKKITGPKKLETKSGSLNISNQPQSTGSQPKIKGLGFGGDLYDINPLTGAGSTGPNITQGGPHPQIRFSGMASSTSVPMWALTHTQSPAPYQSVLMPIYANNTLGGPTPLKLAGNTWICSAGVEGDLAYDKAGGALYATCRDTAWKLVTIDPANGNVSIKGPMPSGGAFTAIAFNSVGTLYALDTLQRKLWNLNKANPASSPVPIPLTMAPGQQMPNTSTSGSMGFTDAGGIFAAFGNVFVSINPSTGVMSILSTGLASPSGLIVTGGGVTEMPK
jgi:hypothetical protein